MTSRNIESAIGVGSKLRVRIRGQWRISAYSTSASLNCPSASGAKRSILLLLVALISYSARAGKPARRALVNRATCGVSSLAAVDPWRKRCRPIGNAPVPIGLSQAVERKAGRPPPGNSVPYCHPPPSMNARITVRSSCQEPVRGRGMLKRLASP